jgi:hypothetical protein
MNEEMHKLILSLGFVLLDAERSNQGPKYHHKKLKLTFEPVADLTMEGLGEALIIGGMAVQKLETMKVISEAAKKLGFKF